LRNGSFYGWFDACPYGTVGPQRLTSREGVEMKIKSVGSFLLGVWLILSGLIALVDLSFSGLMPLMAILALGAGLLTIVGK
jgi:hypothetical protein